MCVVVWLSYMLDSAKAVKVAWKNDISMKKQLYKQLLPGLTFLNIFKVAHVLMDSHAGMLKEDEKRVTLKVVSLVVPAEVHCTRVMHSSCWLVWIDGVKVGLKVDLLQGISSSALTNVRNELLKIWEWMLKSFITLLVLKSIMISNIKVAYVRSLPCRIQILDLIIMFVTFV